MDYQPNAKKEVRIMSLTGSPDQLYSARRLQLVEGPAAGMRLIEIITAGGMRALFCESRALDLYEVHYKGINIGFASKNGLQGGRVLPLSGDFTPFWPGGMLATCGLRNTGPDCTVDGEYHPMHGHIGGQAAQNVSVKSDIEEGTITISGQVRESALFGHNLLLERIITIDIHGADISWQDRVVNQAAEPEPVFLLYHFNFGYPFLSPDMKIDFPPGEVIPRTEDAEAGLAEYDVIREPEDGCTEQVFFHYPLKNVDSETTAEIKLNNPVLGITARLFYNPAVLPVLTQWKSMKSGDYALGIEPGTSRLRGRGAEIEAGYDNILPGFSSWQIPVRLLFS